MELSNKDVPESDFVWEDYLEETKSYAASPNSFVHVEYSLESGFKMGMKMEVPNKEEEDHYWVASVIMTCGPLLSVRYAGYGDDRSADFWVDVKSGDVHPVGWCNKSNKPLSPPKGVRERHKDIKLLLNKELLGAATVPASLLEDPSAGMTPIDQIKVQMKVEIIDDRNPKNVWIATIIQNVGGRLLLRYDGTTGTTDDFWQFYLSSRVHQVGWAKSRAAEFSYSPPESKKFQHTEENWNEILSSSFKEAKLLPFPEEVLEPQIAVEEHSFEEGMKLEALNPETLLEICPGTVIKVINKFYFMVSIDSYTDKEKENKPFILCHSNSHEVFPINWAAENGLELTYPEGYREDQQNEKFDWDAYLTFCNAKAAPADLFLMIFMNMGFDAEKKLEAVNPFAADQICAATVKKVADPLMWIRLESVGLHSSEIISTVDSFDIFPVGWCGSNGYPLQAPLVPKPAHKYLKAPQQPKDSSAQQKKSDENDSSPPKEQSKAWCPRIYFNHRCFSGPLLSKGRLAELPRQVGPGPIALVMKEVLTLLVSVAYKSSRVLSELQLHGKPDPKMQHSVIKAKYKGKSYRATVEFIRSCDQLEEFCRMICKKLDCCPYLFGPFQIVDECPDKCHSLTKTKFGHNFVKKHKKPGRPPLNSYGALAGKKGRRKKRIHWRFLRNLSSVGEKKQESNDSEEKTESEEVSAKRASEPDDSDGVGNERKRHKPTAVPPPRSEIVTRGAKLPNFGLEMKWRHNVSPFLPRKVGRPPGRPSLTFSGRKVGRPIGSKKKIIMPSVVKHLRNSSQHQQKEVEQKVAVKEEEVPNGLNLESDPMKWSVDDVVTFVKETECAPMAWVLKEQEIDGQALLMLTLPSVQEFLHLKTGPARLLCSLVEKVKFEYLTRFAQNHS